MPNIETIPQDVYKLFQQDEHHDCNEDNLQAFGENIKQLVRERLATRPDSDPLRFSALGKPDRQLWYAANAPDKAEPMLPKQYLKFLYGDVIEQLMLFLIKEAGHTVEMEQAEIEVDGVKGHIDAVIDGVVVDVKSASPFAFQKFKKGTLFEDDAFGYIGQISGYSNVLTPDTGGAFVAFDKVAGDICTLAVPAEVADDFKPVPRIAHLKEVIASPDKPPRCYPDVEDGKSGNRKLGVNCSYCAFKWDCYPDLRGFIYANGPKYLTHVARLPDVPEMGIGPASIDDEEIKPF